MANELVKNLGRTVLGVVWVGAERANLAYGGMIHELLGSSFEFDIGTNGITVNKKQLRRAKDIRDSWQSACEGDLAESQQYLRKAVKGLSPPSPKASEGQSRRS